MKDSLSLKLTQGAMVIISLILLYIGYLVLQAAPNVGVVEPIKLSSMSVKAGDKIKMSIEYCSEREFTQKIEVQLVDVSLNSSAYTLYTIDEAHTRKGCHTTPLEIDTARFQAYLIDSGEYKLRIRGSVKVNLIKYDIKKYDSQKFIYKQ